MTRPEDKLAVTHGRIRVPVRRAGPRDGAPADPVADPGADDGSRSDWVAVEEPLEIRLAWGPTAARESATVSITMRTPGDDVDLAAGFLYTEGIVRAGADILQVEAGTGTAANLVVVELRPGIVVDLGRLNRHVLTSSACGVCGKTSIEAVRSECPWPIDGTGPLLTGRILAGLPEALAARQPGFRDTGGLHAAALFDAAGTLLDVREDVGRHNAVDKLIGAALRANRLPLAAAGLLVSSRASFEILQKARMAGCPLVVAVGAPSSLAIELAWDAGMTLVGFLRGGRFNIYAGPARIVEPMPA